jgi:spore coat polysaccharide biosynthesis protein SpsF
MIDEYLAHADDCDYMGMGDPSPYPYGLDAEVFSFRTLEKAWREARLSSEREHVTPFIWKNPQIFRLSCIPSKVDLSYLMWAVDNENDLEYVRTIYKKINKNNKLFTTDDVFRLLKNKPEIQNINKNSKRREGYYKSLNNDNKLKSKK